MPQITSIKNAVEVAVPQSGDYGGTIRSEFPGLDLRWGEGTDAAEADLVWEDLAVTLATATTRSLDLRSLTGGPGGTTVTLVEVRGLWIRCRDYALTFAKGAANGWTGLGSAWTITFPAGTWVCLVNSTDGGLATGASNKVIDISNASGSTATYDLLAVGVSV